MTLFLAASLNAAMAAFNFHTGAYSLSLFSILLTLICCAAIIAQGQRGERGEKGETGATGPMGMAGRDGKCTCGCPTKKVLLG